MAVTNNKQNNPSDLDSGKLSDKEMESWFGMLDDASKAEVMKAKIAADAATEQCRIKETEQSRRTTETDDDFLITRTWTRIIGTVAGAIVLGLCCNFLSNCSNDRKEAEIYRLKTTQAIEEAKLGHFNSPPPPTTAQAAAPPASAAPASSGK